MTWESAIDMYTTMCKIESQQEPAAYLRELTLMLCDDLEGWDGGAIVGGRSQRKGMSVYAQLIHFISQQKLTQHCKATILFSFFFKKKDHMELPSSKVSTHTRAGLLLAPVVGRAKEEEAAQKWNNQRIFFFFCLFTTISRKSTPVL